MHATDFARTLIIANPAAQSVRRAKLPSACNAFWI